MNSDHPNPPSIDQQPIRSEQPPPHDQTDTAAAHDGLTVLLCQGDHTASKRHIRTGDRWDTIEFDLGFKFRPEPHEINGLTELAALIEKVRRRHDAVVVRGELTPEALAAIQRDPTCTIARRKNDHGDGIPASLVEAKRRWIMVDVDSYPLPADADLTTDIGGIIDGAIRTLLPAQFHDAECFYQLSNSCGFVPGVLKVHLFFWLSEPAPNGHLRVVFKQHAPFVDTAPFNAVQPHYLADPVVEGGDDPIPLRTGWRHGKVSAVILPDLIPPSATGNPGGSAAPRGSRGKTIAAALARLGDGEGRDGFHAPLLAASMQYAIGCSRGGSRDDGAFIDKLRAEIEAAPRRDDRVSVAAYLDIAYLERIIQGAFALIEAARKQDDDEPAMRVQLPAGFGMTRTGLWFTDPGKEDASPEWVSAPFQVVGECEDGAGSGWGVVLRWFDPAGRPHVGIVPRMTLHSEPSSIAGLLESTGLRCNPTKSAQQSLRRFLASVRPEVRLRAVERAGWHNGVYVLADGTVYGSGDVMLRPELTRSDNAVAQAGSLAEWQDHVARYAIGNSRLALFISTALAAPLLDIIAEPSGGIHLHGRSQSGKSTAAYVAASVWGKGARDGAVHQWRATINGLEGLAARSSDNAVVLDEISQSDARAAGEAIYLLANEQGKQRAGQSGAARPRLTWRIVFLSTGETTLAQRMAEGGKRPMAGMEVRLVNIHADAGADMGVFETLHGFQHPGALADYLRESAAKYFGVAGRAFLARMVEERAADADSLYAAVKGLRLKFIADHVPDGADGQVRSVAGRFGLIAAAGEIATVCDILPWPEGEATRAASACFKAWLVARGGVGAGEDHTAVRQIRAFLEMHGTSRFATISHERGMRGEVTHAEELRDSHTINRAGWRRFNQQSGCWDYLILPETWANEVCRGLDPIRAAKAVNARGWLTPGDSRHLAKQESIPEAGRLRVYVVSGAILGGFEEE